jgi:hypothetical protein
MTSLDTLVTSIMRGAVGVGGLVVRRRRSAISCATGWAAT